MSNSYYMQHMLLQYGRQLTTARRLARHRQALRLATGDAPSIPVDVKRALMVDRVTSEVVENLLLAGAENPIVQEVKDRLSRELGELVTFRYPPGELDMRIFRDGPEGQEEIVSGEKARIMDRLWAIAKETVDATML